jgi:protein phosphatase
MDKKELLQLIRNATMELDVLPPLLEFDNVEKIVFVGDTHTAVEVTEYVIREYWDMVDKIVFLGDYVDRGYTGIENLTLLLSKYLNNKNKIVLLRGNHETPSMNEYYGFYYEVLSKYDLETYIAFTELFKALPYALKINNLLCLHGGLPKGLSKIEEIKKLNKEKEPSDPISLQLLWNDPRDGIDDFIPSTRGEGIYFFGERVTEKFLSENGLEKIIRGHEAVNGFKENFKGRVITVFSSLYHGYPPGVLVYNKGNFEKIKLVEIFS